MIRSGETAAEFRARMGFSLPKFLAGLTLGVIILPIVIAYPAVVSAVVDAGAGLFFALGDQFEGNIATVVNLAVAALFLVLVLWFVRRGVAHLIRNSVLFGFIFGGTLWVMFGNHAVAYVPGLDNRLPTLHENLNDFVGRTRGLRRLRSIGEGIWPLPSDDVDAAASQSLRQLLQIEDGN